MPNAGDTFTVTLGKTHLGWGTHRYTSSRDKIEKEGYIPIPSKYAKQYGIHNANFGRTGLGYNEFNAQSADGTFKGVLKASGNNKAGDIYAKNLHGSGDLKALGRWFNQVNMQPGDQVKVKWTSATKVILEKL